jgi:hypothetical protein
MRLEIQSTYNLEKKGKNFNAQNYALVDAVSNIEIWNRITGLSGDSQQCEDTFSS